MPCWDVQWRCRRCMYSMPGWQVQYRYRFYNVYRLILLRWVVFSWWYDVYQMPRWEVQ